MDLLDVTTYQSLAKFFCWFESYWKHHLQTYVGFENLVNFLSQDCFLPCADIVADKGTDAWWYLPTEELLPQKYHDVASDYQKGTDTMDVWFDSGKLLSL